MTRPWRLTRRQRVEMEALRSRMWVSDRASDVLRACALLGWDSRAGDRWPASGRDWRLLRARVAIALRAALRADEDARCEEALRRAGYGEETGATPGDGWDVGYDEGALAALDLLREWPGLARDLYTGRVQLALWEVVR